ncbi:hypothetical protein K9M48_01670 [Candidatus Gracilibacteria bacterium]|nr:hypothetical protein [Candidatus Gracilibacteria bacterium]
METKPEEKKDKTPEKKAIPTRPIKKRKGAGFYALIAVGALVIAALVIIMVRYYSNNNDSKKATKTEQVDPGKTQPGQPGPGVQQPINQIDLPQSNGEYNWSVVDQPMLTKVLTTTPNLNGETVLLVYIIKGHPSGDMVWIQTEYGGKVRNVMCERKYTKL